MLEANHFSQALPYPKFLETLLSAMQREGLPLRSSCPRLPVTKSHCSVTMSARTAETWSDLQEDTEQVSTAVLKARYLCRWEHWAGSSSSSEI